MGIISYSPHAWKILHGVFCIYKPPNVSLFAIRRTLIGNLIRDLNELEVRPPSDYIKIEGSVSSRRLSVLSVPNYADHPLVVGPRHQCQDVRLTSMDYVAKHTSGVVVVGVNNGCSSMSTFHEAKPIRVYEIKAKFGIATDNFMETGSKVREKATFDNITLVKLDRVLASLQAMHQFEAYKYARVDVQSQTAYELASKGLIRPAGKSPPLIYGIRCTHFEPPDFTLEVHCINEKELFLRQMVHDIGLTLKSCAVCSQIRRIRFGPFTTEHALLRKAWTLEHILNNIHACKDLAKKSVLLPETPHLKRVTEAERHVE